MGNGRLLAYINAHCWWRTALPDRQAIEARGVFLASSYRDAEFYGRPIDSAFRVNVSNPLFGDEPEIMQTLGLPEPSQNIRIKERFSLDAKIMRLAAKKGYDSIALSTSRAYRDYVSTGRIPRSIELQVFSLNHVAMDAELERGPRLGLALGRP